MSPNIKLTYFNTPGLAEFIRLMLNYGNVEFEDIRIDRENWPDIKPTMPFGTVPVYEEDGKRVAESTAIGRHVARKVGLAGQNDWEDLEIDGIVDTIKDFKAKLGAAYKLPKEDPTRADKMKVIFEEVCPFYCERLEKLAKENNGYLVGNRLTWVDFYFTTFTDYIKPVVEKYEHLKAVRNHVYEQPGVKRWLEIRPNFDYTL